MAHLHYFAYGWVTPILAYLFSFIGCLSGLKATARARVLTSGRQRARWLILAAWAIGGTGIWVMHFIAMIGFAVSGSEIRFDLGLTLASWMIAVVVVGAGLFFVGYRKPSALKIITAGVFTGAGVAAMHYSGMAAMRIDGMTSYIPGLVVASVAIAVVAAIVALWFTVSVQRTGAVVTAAAIMALAVCGMHYTGMAALRVHVPAVSTPVTGIPSLAFLVPIFVFVLTVVVALGYAMLNSLSEQDAVALDVLQARLRTPGDIDTPAPGAGFTRRRN